MYRILVAIQLAALLGLDATYSEETIEQRCSHVSQRLGRAFDPKSTTRDRLEDIEGRIKIADKLKKEFDVTLDPARTTLNQLRDLEARIVLSKRISAENKIELSWRTWSLTDLLQKKQELDNPSGMALHVRASSPSVASANPVSLPRNLAPNLPGPLNVASPNVQGSKISPPSYRRAPQPVVSKSAPMAYGGDRTVLSNDGRSWNTIKWLNGDTTTFGSDGTSYNSLRWNNGDRTTFSSDGRSWDTFQWLNGDTTTFGSDGTSYNSLRWSNGDRTTFSSDGRSWDTFQWLNGDTTTFGSDGTIIDSFGW